MPSLNMENTLLNCSVPLRINDRFFVVNKGEKEDLFTVFVSEGDEVLIFEVVENTPEPNPLTEVTKGADGLITATNRLSGDVEYEIRPGYKGSSVFGYTEGGEVEVSIDDRLIKAGNTTLEASQIQNEVGLVVGNDGQVSRGSSLPEPVRALFDG
jgi:hypothetical protein